MFRNNLFAKLSALFSAARGALSAAAVALPVLVLLLFPGPCRPQDRESAAIANMRRNAEWGDDHNQFILGSYYRDGKGGLPRDYALAAHWYRKAAEPGFHWNSHTAEWGNPLAQLELAALYEKGLGVPRDAAQALAWNVMAALRGYSDARKRLAKNGAVCSQGLEQLTLEAERGMAWSQNLLGALFQWGWCVARDDAQAARWHRKAAEQGHADAQFNLALLYEQGWGLPEDEEQALAWYSMAAAQGHAKARVRAKRLTRIRDERGRKRSPERDALRGRVEKWEDPLQPLLPVIRGKEDGEREPAREALPLDEAAEWGDAASRCFLGGIYEAAVRWGEAAERGDADAQFTVGSLYEHGQGLPRDEAQALVWYRKAAARGHEKARDKVGQLERRRASRPPDRAGRGHEAEARPDRLEQVRQHPPRLAKLLRAAEQGDAEAQYKLGLRYRHGKGLRRDDVQAARWFRRAAEQGLAEAQSVLGWMCLMGEGVARDEEQAAVWYLKAADQGRTEPLWRLGLNYNRDNHGRGLPRDEKRAAYWFRQAAERGDARGRHALGGMYRHGRGVERDDEQAFRWISEAAEQGLAWAQYDLGQMYEQGIGVERNDELALFWYFEAAARDVSGARKKLEQLEKRRAERELEP